MVCKFFKIWKSYENRLSEGPNSTRFYLTVLRYGMYGRIDNLHPKWSWIDYELYTKNSINNET